MIKFEITDEEEKVFEKWNKKHKKKCTYLKSSHQSAEGARLIYSFTPTGLGMIIIVKCICGEECHLTNSDNW